MSFVIDPFGLKRTTRHSVHILIREFDCPFLFFETRQRQHSYMIRFHQKPRLASHVFTSRTRLPLISMVPPVRIRIVSSRGFLGIGIWRAALSSLRKRSRSPVTFLIRVVTLAPSFLWSNRYPIYIKKDETTHSLLARMYRSLEKPLSTLTKTRKDNTRC